MIFPKCMLGGRPFISYEGQVLPCCWIGVKRGSDLVRTIDKQFAENIFLRSEFNLHNRSYKEIVTSDEWLLNLEKLFYMKYNVCHVSCKKMITDNNVLKVGSKHVNQTLVYAPQKIEEKSVVSADVNLFNKNLVETWNINKIQLELTSKCSLKCGYCPRLTDKPKKTDLDIKIVKDLIDCKNWSTVSDVGNYGDSIFYNHYHEFLSHLIGKNIEIYSVHIAATGRSKQWWEETLSLYKKIVDSGTIVKIKFGIDGLENTSKLHRVGQNWDEITYAMKKAAQIGCDSIWKFIPMSFNEHQIEEASELARKWNVRLMIAFSSRFKKNDPNKPTNRKLVANDDDS